MTQAEATLFVYDDLIRIFLLASVLTILTMTNYPVFLLISIIWLTVRRF